MLKQLINLFIKTNGRKPNSLEMLQLKFKAAQQSGKGQILRPEFGKKKPWYKDKPTTGKGEVIDASFKPGMDAKGNIVEESPSQRTARIKQGFSTQSKLNNWSSNQQWVKDFIGRKNKEFNSLSKADQKEVLEMFETQIKKHMPKEPKAYGGLAGMLGERTGYENGLKVTDDDFYLGDPGFLRELPDPYKDLPEEEREMRRAMDKIMAERFTADPYEGMSDEEIEKIKERNRIERIIRERQRKEMGLPEGVQLLAGGGLAGMLGEPTYTDENHRVPYKDGTKFDPKRRTVLKGIGALATLPIIGKYFKWAKPLAKTSKTLTSVPIGSAEGMPAWFKPLVNKVIKEGTNVSSKASTLERQIVHKTELPNSKTDVYVTQDLNTGNVWVDIGASKHGFADGKFGQPVRLEYKAAEEIEPILAKHMDPKNPKGEWLPNKSQKTKEEFTVEEAEFTGGHPENIKFEETSINKFGKHESDFSEVEAFAKGKIKKDARKVSESLQKEGEDLADHFSNYPTPDDFASGGRVPLKGGKLAVLEGLAALMKKLFPGTTKLGQTSKPMAPKTELKRSIAGFQERQKNKKIRETIKADEKAVAKLKKEHEEKYGKWVYTKDRSEAVNKQSKAFYKKIDDLQNKIDKNRYLVDDVVIDGKKYKLSDKDRPPTETELEDDYAELWDDENSPLDFGSTIRELDAALVDRAEDYKYMYQQYKMGKLDPEAGSVSRARLNLLRKRAEEAEDTKDFRLFGEDEADELEYLSLIHI